MLYKISLLLIFLTIALALPEQRRCNGPLDPRVVAEIEADHGKLPWLTERDDSILMNPTLDKRATWAGLCGLGIDGAYYISKENRVFLMRCSWTWSQPNTIGSGLVVVVPDLASCSDRCANSTYFNLGSQGGCKVAELRNNGECRMYISSNVGTSTPSAVYNALSTGHALAQYITSASCDFPNICSNPIFTTGTRGYFTRGSTTCTNSCAAPIMPSWTSMVLNLSSSTMSLSITTKPAALSSVPSPVMISIVGSSRPSGAMSAGSSPIYISSTDMSRESTSATSSPAYLSLGSIESSSATQSSNPTATTDVNIAFTSSGPSTDFSSRTSSKSISLGWAGSSITSAEAPAPTPVTIISYPQNIMCPNSDGVIYRISSGELLQIECYAGRDGSGWGFSASTFAECLNLCNSPAVYGRSCYGVRYEPDSTGTNCLLYWMSLSTSAYYSPDVWAARNISFVAENVVLPVTVTSTSSVTLELEGSSSSHVPASSTSSAALSILSIASSILSTASVVNPTPSATYQYPQNITCPEAHNSIYNNSYGELYLVECGITHIGNGGGMGPMSFTDCIGLPDKYYWSYAVGVIWDSASTNCMLMTSMEEEPYFIPEVWNARRLSIVPPPRSSSISSSATPSMTSSVMERSSASSFPISSRRIVSSTSANLRPGSTTSSQEDRPTISLTSTQMTSSGAYTSGDLSEAATESLLLLSSSSLAFSTLTSSVAATLIPVVSSQVSSVLASSVSQASSVVATIPASLANSSHSSSSKQILPSSAPTVLIQNGGFDPTPDGLAPPWVFLQEEGAASISFGNDTATMIPSPLTPSTKLYLYQPVTGIRAGASYIFSIEVFVALPPEAECLLDYGAGSQTLRTTKLDSFSPTRYTDVLSGAFNANAGFFFIRLTCEANGNEGGSVGVGNVGLSVN